MSKKPLQQQPGPIDEVLEEEIDRRLRNSKEPIFFKDCVTHSFMPKQSLRVYFIPYKEISGQEVLEKEKALISFTCANCHQFVTYDYDEVDKSIRECIEKEIRDEETDFL